MIDLRLHEFCKDRSGAALILATLMMPVFVGSLGLGGEAGYRYYNQRLLQHAADFAAHAGAVRLSKGDDDAAIEAAALGVATGSGFMLDVGVVPISDHPPTSGFYAGDLAAVEVRLVETRPRLFSAIFSNEPVEIGARAVALVDNSATSSACILALSGTSPGAVTVTGNNTATLAGCSVASNSTSESAVSIPNGAAVLDVECISTPGGISTNVNAQVETDDCMLTGAAAVQDPYYWVAEPTGSCPNPQSQNRNVGQPNKTTAVTTTGVLPNGVPVGYFCNGLAAKGTVTFTPGVYIISGGTMTAGGTEAQLIGTGVTFYLTNGAAVNIGSLATLNLSAPTSGPYSGFLFFGSRTNPVAHSIQGTATSVVEGAVYMPASEITFRGNSAAISGCTQIIADTVKLTGDSTITADCSNDNVEEILVGQVIAVVE